MKETTVHTVDIDRDQEPQFTPKYSGDKSKMRQAFLKFHTEGDDAPSLSFRKVYTSRQLFLLKISLAFR